MAELLFWSGFGLLLVSSVVYPLWVSALARLRPLPVAAAHLAEESLPRVTCLIAAANEAPSIARKLEAVTAQEYPAGKLAVIVVSDGSSDGTDEIVAEWARRDPRVRLLRKAPRSGKPSALNLARGEIAGDVLVLMDVRQGLSRDAVRELVAHLADPTVGVVSGNLSLPHDAYWSYESRVRRAESRSGSMVQVTGSLYALRAADFPELPPETVLDDVYVPLVVAASGRRIVLAEKAISIDAPTRRVRDEFTRKVRTLAGLVQVCHLLGRRLLPGRNPVWARFVLHKLSRLAVPYAMLLVAAGCLTAGGWAAMVTQAAMGLLLVLAAAPRLGVRSRLSTLSRSFLGLTAAALCAVPFYYLGLVSVTWTRLERDTA